MTDSFTLAQQAANVAYDLTLSETGDVSQAADDYSAVMTAYNAKAYPTMRTGWIPVGDSDGAVTRAARLAEVTVERYNAAQAANEGADFDVLEDEYITREDWRHCRIAE